MGRARGGPRGVIAGGRGRYARQPPRPAPGHARSGSGHAPFRRISRYPIPIFQFPYATQPRFVPAGFQAPIGKPEPALARPGSLVLAPLTGCRRVARHPLESTRTPSYPASRPVADAHPDHTR